MYSLIREGDVKILVPKGVFYNSLAKFSRSIGVAVVNYESIFKSRLLSALDLLAASGIRGLRYYVESNGIDKIVFNDRSISAVKAIERNVSLNKCNNYEVYNLDGNLLLHLNRGLYDVIDIDPFGSPSPYIDSAVAGMKHGGLIVVTATDLSALCGVYPKSGFRKYGVIVRKTSFCHETALRILIRNIVDSAGRHFKIAYPIISYFSEQYARIYMRIFRGKQAYPYDKIGYLIYRENEDIRVLKSMELENFYENDLIGPLWIGPLHNKEYVKGILENQSYMKIADENDSRRSEKLFRIFIEESEMPPYHFNIHKVCKVIKVSPPPLEKIMENLRSLGYRVSRTHFSGYSLKTDSPVKTLFEVLRDLGR